MTDFDAAAVFIWLHARLIDRHRFAHHFLGAGREPIVHALRAYRNDDGGFGHALEPDLRGPVSQPAGVMTALELLHEAGADDDPMIEPACEFLAGIARPDGGIPFVLPSATGYPRGPWWQPADESSLTQTAANAAALHALGRSHPWLDRATEYVWRRVAAADFFDNSYDTLFTVAFLDAVPDAARAEEALDALRPGIERAAGETHAALQLSRSPAARSRRVLAAGAIERDLDALAAGQRDDGGWTFDFPAWSRGAELDWRGIVTFDALKTLRAHGRL